MVETKQDKYWMFGYGANLNATHLAKKKKLTVLDSCAAKVPGWYLAFPKGGFPYVDPSFASAYRKEGEEIHGLAYAVNKGHFDKCNALEGGGRVYDQVIVTLHLYDGRKVEGQIYTRKELKEEGTPSRRYLNLIIEGAKEANLDAAYVKKVSEHPVYVTPQELLDKRALLPKPESLPKMGYEELKASARKDNRVHICILGYIFKLPKEDIMMKNHIGRDITNRQIRYWNNEPTDPDDDTNDLGRPPYPDVDKLSEGEREYCWQWLDHYLHGDCKGDLRCVVAFLAEWDHKL